jgi:hypothetical protein
MGKSPAIYRTYKGPGIPTTEATEPYDGLNFAWKLLSFTVRNPQCRIARLRCNKNLKIVDFPNKPRTSANQASSAHGTQRSSAFKDTFELVSTAIVSTFLVRVEVSQTFRQLVLRSMSTCLFVSASSHVTYRRLEDGNCLAGQLLLSKARQSPGWEGTDYVNRE